jgi:antagonist of KipI
MIVVERAPPYLTIQDEGRPGYRTSGVPVGGAMDRWSLAVANALVGNDGAAAALEWAIGGGALRFKADSTIALCGSEVEATVDGAAVEKDLALDVRAGQLLEVYRFIRRRFLYVAIRGGISTPPVLGSRSTYLPAALGGLAGRRLAREDSIPIGDAGTHRTRQLSDLDVDAVRPDYDAESIRVIVRRSPSAELTRTLLQRSFTVSPASDRTGYRLDTASPLAIADSTNTSEPVCSGVIQLPSGGQPIVLMADAPTIGGYRILGTVVSCDLPILAQFAPGVSFTFEETTVDDAQRELRRRNHTTSKWS